MLVVAGAGGVFGAFTASVSSTGNQFVTASDLTPPTVARAVLRKSYGGVSGFTGCGLGGCSVLDARQFFLYAQVADGGDPPSGISSVNGTVGGASANMSDAGGPWTVDGQSFNYRSNLLTRSSAQLSPGTRSFTINAADSGGRSVTSSPYAFDVDTTRPAPTTVDVANGSGSPGRPDAGDTITYEYDSPIDPSSILGNWTSSGPPTTYTDEWNGGSTAVVAVLAGPSKYGGEPDDSVRIRVERTANMGGNQVNVGEIRSHSNDWALQCEARFNATLAMPTSTKVLVTLGSEITSGVITTPAPATPSLEDC
ncbi:MAG: hypothetical protein J0H98_10750 [Solirubrobacterales bacterium]|nr:hypothetical protein [Solirubrobacterales bacterium]